MGSKQERGRVPVFRCVSPAIVRLFAVIFLSVLSVACDREPRDSSAGPALEPRTVIGPETGAIASVEGRELSLDRFNSIYEYRVGKVEMPSNSGLGQAYALQIKRRVANELIDEALVRHEAQRRAVQLEQADIDAALQAFAASFPSKAVYRRHLAAFRGGEAALRDSFELRLLKEQLAGVEQLTPPSDREARRFYADHSHLYRIPPHLQARMIQLRLGKGATDETRSVLRKKAAELRNAARGGKSDFASLARRHSQHKSARIGGYLGRVDRDTLTPALWKALQTLKPGEVSEVVESGDALYLLMLVARHPGQARAFDEVREEIKANIAARRASSLVARLMAGLRAEAEIENHLARRYHNFRIPAAQPQTGAPVKSPDRRQGAPDHGEADASMEGESER